MEQEKTASLVLLPPPPVPRSPESLSAAYRPGLETALHVARSTTTPALLVVAVSYPLVDGTHLVWQDAQELLAGLYSLLVVLCRQQKVETGMDDGAGSVDARVVLLRSGSGSKTSTAAAPNETVLVDLATFAAAHRQTAWDSVFYPENPAGWQLCDEYMAVVGDDSYGIMVAVAGGHELLQNAQDTTPLSSPTTLHKIVCLGGTFDYLHPGHKLLLSAGALLLRCSPSSSSSSPPQPCEYVIGITGDELLRNKKYAELVQPWRTRAQAVVAFLSTILDLSIGDKSTTSEKDGELRATFRNGAISVLCVRIHDAYGPTVECEDISCLVVSGETRAGGAAVNKKRAEKGWPLLETFVVDVLNADGMAVAAAASAATATESFDAKISSSAIRRRRAEAAGM